MQADRAADGAEQVNGLAGRPPAGSTVYKPFITGYGQRGAHIHCTIGVVTPCGEWVDAGQARYQLGSQWHLRRCDAEASLADEIEVTGRRLMDQAAALRRAAQ